jgi:hypothetical protein
LGLLLEALVRRSAAEGAVGPVVVVVTFPFLELVAEQSEVVDDLHFDESVVAVLAFRWWKPSCRMPSTNYASYR